jgi:hypothetical protein
MQPTPFLASEDRGGELVYYGFGGLVLLVLIILLLIYLL